MRLFTAMLGTETNAFSPIPVGFKLYQDFYLVRGGRHTRPYGFFALPLVRFRERAKALGWEVVESLATFAPIARGIVYAASPACIDVNYRRLPYTKVRRPIWPLDENPWT